MTADQRVVVAGATGYLGRYVVQALRREGCRVRALVRNANRNARALARMFALLGEQDAVGSGYGDHRMEDRFRQLLADPR